MIRVRRRDSRESGIQAFDGMTAFGGGAWRGGSVPGMKRPSPALRAPSPTLRAGEGEGMRVSPSFVMPLLDRGILFGGREKDARIVSAHDGGLGCERMSLMRAADG